MKKHLNKIKFAIMLLPIIVAGIGIVNPFADTASATSYSTIGSGIDASGRSGEIFGTNGIFIKITNTLLFIIGAIAVLMLIYGGIRYTISGGESGAVANAKNTILYAIVGIVVALLAYGAVNFVIGQLGVSQGTNTSSTGGI